VTPAMLDQWYAGTFPGSPEQIGLARRAVKSYLGSCPASDDVALVVSELATNAAVHSESRDATFTLRVELHPTWVQVECEDAGGPWFSRPADDSRPHGLSIVANLARAWGVSTTASGRVVWARLDFRAPPR